jgi:retron-type reverse transcriptase
MGSGSMASLPAHLRRVLACRVQRGDRRVAVVAANADHANRLLDQLPPGWAGVGDGVRPTSAGPVLPGWGQPVGAPHQRAVVIVGALTGFPLGTYDVVVRADGGAGPLPAGVDLGTHVTDAPPVLLVDVHDRFDRDLDRAARHRRAAYRRAGWAAADEPDGFGDLNVYLAWHPCGDGYRRVMMGVADTANDGMAEAPVDGPARSADSIVDALPLLPLGRSTDAEITGSFADRPVGGLGGYTGGRRRRDRWAVVAGRPGYLPTVAEMAHPDNLVAVLRNMIAEGAGAAAGPDGIGLYDLSVADWAVHLRELSRRILDGTYVPGPVRTVKIPKGDGTFRSIEVESVAARVMAVGMDRGVSPFLDPLFLAGSFGFRPRLSHWHMLAAVKKAVELNKVYVLINDDVKNCFPSARTDLVLADAGRVIPDPGVMSLITAAVRGHGSNRKEGLSTGSPISPLLLNTHLHFRHDLPVDRERFIAFWGRYADNVCYLVRNATEGERALDLSRTLLNEVGLDLKGQKKDGERVPGEPTDLRERPTNLLGFNLTAKPDVVLEIPDDAWNSLTDALQEAHESNDPPAQARSILYGWAEACGPALEYRVDTILQSILSTARHTGFPRVLTAERLRDVLDGALRRWRTVLRDAPLADQ